MRSVLSILFVLIVVSVSQGQFDIVIPTNSHYKFESEVQRFYTMNASEFKSGHPQLGEWTVSVLLDGHFLSDVGGGNFAYAPVRLRHGAKINRMEAHLTDQDIDGYVAIALKKAEFSDPGSLTDYIVYMETVDTLASSEIIYRSFGWEEGEVVDNFNYSYFISFYASGASDKLRLHNVRLRYTVDKVD